jgi:hypothetical protein
MLRVVPFSDTDAVLVPQNSPKAVISALISAEKKVPAKGPDLLSFHHPSDECA